MDLRQNIEKELALCKCWESLDLWQILRKNGLEANIDKEWTWVNIEKEWTWGKYWERMDLRQILRKNGLEAQEGERLPTDISKWLKGNWQT